MTRVIFKVIDLGASVVFMALCVRAFCVHFLKDIEGRLQRRKLPLIQNSPSLVPVSAIPLKQPPTLSVRSAPDRRRPPSSY
jgi:hypothetical protein